LVATVSFWIFHLSSSPSALEKIFLPPNILATPPVMLSRQGQRGGLPGQMFPLTPRQRSSGPIDGLLPNQSRRNEMGNGVGSHSLAESGLSGYKSVMPRRPRMATGGCVYHAINRAVGRSTIFEKVDDYAAFEAVLEEAREQVDMRLLAFCVMPNQAVQVVSDSGRRALRACGTESTGAPGLALPSAKRSGSRPRRSVWDWNPRYVPPAAQNASVPTGEPSHDAANRHK
jgi:hypothetical protein